MTEKQLRIFWNTLLTQSGKRELMEAERNAVAIAVQVPPGDGELA